MTFADPRVTALRDALPGQVLLGSRGVKLHLREQIGEGGQGWVYRATWDQPDGFLVSVKVLRPDAVSAETLHRFQREAEVLRALAQGSRPNPHIVRFFDHAVTKFPSPRGGEPIPLHFTVLEYVHGTNLECVLGQSRHLGMPLDRARRLLRHVVLALEDVHRHDVVHRDLKPSNILIADEQGAEVAKVTDFGLVKIVDMGLQQTTALAGASLGYAPPEQYEQGNQRVSVRTDVFSLAAIVFEMLAGTAAFPYREGEHPLIVVTRLLSSSRPRLSAYTAALAPELRGRPDVVAHLDAEFARALSPDPSDRQESITAFWAALEPLLGVTAPLAPRAMSVPAPWSPPGAAGTAPAPHGAVLAPTLASPGAMASARRGGGAMQARSAAAPAFDPRVANPASWAWRVLTRGGRPDAVRAAYFAAAGEAVIAAGPAGLARWDRGAWTSFGAPPDLDVAAVRGLAALAGGDVLVFGERGLVGRVDGTGRFDRWPVPDVSLAFLGAYVEPGTAQVTLVGERPSSVGSPRAHASGRVGSIAQLDSGRLRLITDAPGSSRLRGVTRVADGSFVACGDFGALVRLSSGVAEHVGSICGGHLTAIAALPGGGAVTIGMGGHALALSPRLEATLEAVQTTRDLACLAIAEDGAAWAGAAHARLLRRHAGSWLRMSGDLGLASAVLAVFVDGGRVRAACDDGSVLEGVVT